MSDTAIIINAAVAVLAAVLLIVRFRLDPVISLIIESPTAPGSLFACMSRATRSGYCSPHGQSTRGTSKTCSVGVYVASVVAILLTQPLALID